MQSSSHQKSSIRWRNLIETQKRHVSIGCILLLSLFWPSWVWAEDSVAMLAKASLPMPISQAKALQKISDQSLLAEVLQPSGSSASPQTPDPSPVPLETAPDRPQSPLQPEKRFSVYFGSKLADPSSLLGPSRPPIVLAASNLEGQGDILID